jgi:hypothetical protein
MSRSHQAVKVIVSLVGLQDTAVTAHRPGTDGAAVSVRVGGALIYIQDAATATSFSRVWQAGAREVRWLPVTGDPTRLTPVAGVAEPAVMMEAAGSPPATARLERPAGRPSNLWVTLGRVVFDVRDHAAFRSSMAAFRRAEELAATAFPPAPSPSVREQAAITASRLFAARTTTAGSSPNRQSRPVAAPRPARAARPAIDRTR